MPKKLGGREALARAGRRCRGGPGKRQFRAGCNSFLVKLWLIILLETIINFLQHFTGCMLHASGKFVPLILAHLKVRNMFFMF